MVTPSAVSKACLSAGGRPDQNAGQCHGTAALPEGAQRENLSVCLYVQLSVCVFLYLSVYLSICLYGIMYSLLLWYNVQRVAMVQCTAYCFGIMYSVLLLYNVQPVSMV